MDSAPEPRTAVEPVKPSDEVWWACPVAGSRCVMVSVSMLGVEWAREVLEWHVSNHHRAWH